MKNKNRSFCISLMEIVAGCCYLVFPEREVESWRDLIELFGRVHSKRISNYLQLFWWTFTSIIGGGLFETERNERQTDSDVIIVLLYLMFRTKCHQIELNGRVKVTDRYAHMVRRDGCMAWYGRREIGSFYQVRMMVVGYRLKRTLIKSIPIFPFLINLKL